MVDIVSIIIAVIAFVGSLGAAAIAGWITLSSDERKRLSEAEKLLNKYRDPLLLVAQDLQSRLYNITDQNLTSWINHPGDKRDNLLQYTCFLVGQFLAWTNILRRESQFLRFATDKANKDFTTTLNAISYAFLTDGTGPLGFPFILWKGKQLAIGEIMTVKEDDQHFCMGYSDFHVKWTEDKEFQRWFHTLTDGITVIADARVSGEDSVPDQRLRRIQHLLVCLIHLLDPKGLRSDATRTKQCIPAWECSCSVCLLTRQYGL